MKSRNCKFREDELYSSYIGNVIIIRALNITLSNLGIVSNESFKIILIGFLFLLQLLILLKKADKTTRSILLISEFFTLVFFVLVMLLNIDIVDILSPKYIWLLLADIPIAIVALRIKDYKNTIDILSKKFIYVTIMGVFIANENYKFSSDMILAYLLLLPISIYLFNIFFKEKKNILDFLLLFVNCYVFFQWANRGALVCFLIILICYFLHYLIKYKIRFIPFVIIIIAFCIMLYVLLEANEIYEYLISKGIYIRNLDFLRNSDFLNDNGRNKIYEFFLERIYEKPIFGWGLGASERFISSSPHNIFIELFFEFGIVLGSILSFYILFKIIIVSLRLNEVSGIIKLIFVINGLMPLLFSANYIEWLPFWIMIGVLVNEKKKKNTYYI